MTNRGHEWIGMWECEAQLTRAELDADKPLLIGWLAVGAVLVYAWLVMLAAAAG